MRLRSCGERVLISHNAIIWGESEVILGSDVAIHSFTHIFGSGGVTIGDRTQISALCSIASVTHPKAISARTRLILLPVVIGNDVWIATGAIILPGVTIGHGSIVGAGAVVTGDIPPGSIAFGNPATVRAAVPKDNG